MIYSGICETNKVLVKISFGKSLMKKAYCFLPLRRRTSMIPSQSSEVNSSNQAWTEQRNFSLPLKVLNFSELLFITKDFNCSLVSMVVLKMIYYMSFSIYPVAYFQNLVIFYTSMKLCGISLLLLCLAQLFIVFA